ncbi:sigma-E factor negative regulatory protein [Castellaniella sp.]|uniref:sigma-E factor negative regulatory protein n=1 Tax=Castellaniella sp. TaxID=1955812 RepID=UPI002AFF05DF|nr:sigma-E factor negative regulatory protein [Castellaniella sp.]
MNIKHEPSVVDHDWEASVSSWVDGEADLRAEELDSPYGRQVWDTYHLIGDVMRSQDLAIQPSERFYARVSAAVAAEPAIVAPAPLARHRAWRFGLSSLAVAAAVASVVWMAKPFLSGPDAAPASTPVLAQAAEPETNDPSLADYMAAHQDMAGAGPVRQVSYDGMGSH